MILLQGKMFFGPLPAAHENAQTTCGNGALHAEMPSVDADTSPCGRSGLLRLRRCHTHRPLFHFCLTETGFIARNSAQDRPWEQHCPMSHSWRQKPSFGLETKSGKKQGETDNGNETFPALFLPLVML